jgi:hypothetical protein
MKTSLVCYNRFCRCQKKCIFIGVIISGSLCAFFQFILIVFVKLKFTKIDSIKDVIYGETPIYDLQIRTNAIHSVNYKYIESFYEWRGREKMKKSKNGAHTKSVLEKPKNISKIYGNYFVYSNDNRNYFDYFNSYSVEAGGQCKETEQKCGILNSNGRILCLPKNENCPLNDFFISVNKLENINQNYRSERVMDNFSGKYYYFYYTNTNIENKIITKFKLSHGLPCMLSSERSWISILTYEKDVDPSCKTSINGKLRDDSYTRVQGGDFSLKSLYNDNDIGITETTTSDKTVELYFRNYIHIDENCNNQFFEDIEKKGDSFKKTEIKIKILSGITFLLILLLVIYSILSCCCNLQFYIYVLIVPIIGIILNIVETFFTKTSKLRYKCSDEGYNSIIDDFLDQDYFASKAIILIMCIISIIALIINIIFIICSKFAKEQITTPINNNNYGVAVAVPQVGVNMAPQYPNYPQYPQNPPYPQYPQNPQFTPAMSGQPVPGYGQPIPASSLEYNNLQAKNLYNEQRPIELLNQAPAPKNQNNN